MPDGLGRPSLGPQDWLTQLGPKFYDHPKPGQSDVSLWCGRLSLEDMLYVVGGIGRQQKKRDAVKYYRVGCLQAAGFLLVLDDEPVSEAWHVSVQVEGQWTEEHRTAFRSCAEDSEAEEGQ
jgi:hypothetical protein